LTTLGNGMHGRNDLIPTIGNNVSLGLNVTIIGKVTIGDNVIIGAGSVVVKDIPSNCVAAGNPAKVIRFINEQ
jgi:acetyltransferase-like isoleucine patch superfamily enzyme